MPQQHEDLIKKLKKFCHVHFKDKINVKKIFSHLYVVTRSLTVVKFDTYMPQTRREKIDKDFFHIYKKTTWRLDKKKKFCHVYFKDKCEK